MRQKIVLKRRIIPKVVTLPNGATFTSRYERISIRQLPSNIKVTKVRTIGLRNWNSGIISLNDANLLRNISERKKVRFNPLAIARKKWKTNRRGQTGKGIVDNLANLGIRLGSQAINSSFGKKLISKGIDSIPSIFKYGVSKIKNKNVQRALDSDIANLVVDEVQNQVCNTSKGLFDL